MRVLKVIGKVSSTDDLDTFHTAPWLSQPKFTQALSDLISLHTQRNQANLKASQRGLYSLSGTRMNSHLKAPEAPL